MDNLRPTWDELFLGIAQQIARRSTCLRAQVGAVLVRDNRIISTGYVGAPAGQPHCLDVGCQIGSNLGCSRTIHAESNALIYAAKTGISTNGATIYCTHMPCLDCAKLISNAGIVRFVYIEPYRKTEGEELLLQCGIPITKGLLQDVQEG